MKTKILCLIFLGVLLTSCMKKATIEQEVSVNSYTNCKYRVKTAVWVREYFLGILWVDNISLEKWEVETNIPIEKVDEVKKAQWNKLYPSYLFTKEILESGVDPCTR